MSMIYHSYDVGGVAQNELVAGAYAEHVGTLGYDESLSTISRNAVENRVITARILQDETDYLLKTEAETKYAVEYVNATPTTIRDKIYSVSGSFYAGDSANSTLHELGKVKTVNSQSPDSNGNVTVDTGAMTVNSQTPDSNGNIAIEAVDIPTTTTGVTVQDSLNLAATRSYVQGLYPVGTIYMNDMATTHPFDFGTWQLIDSKFLYGCASNFSDIGNTGGVSTVTLTQANLPAGNVPVQFPAVTGTTGNMSDHSSGWFNRGNPSASGGTQTDGGTFTIDMSFTRKAQKMNLNFDFYPRVHLNIQHTHSITIPAQTLNISLGSGTAFSIIPPYKKVAIWHRIA